MYKKKVAPDLGLNPHTAAAIRKEVLTPPPHPPPKKGYPGTGGWGGQNRKIHGGIIFSPKMMILQGVRHPVPNLEVSYANDPKKGGWMAHAPALDLTTLFEVICLTLSGVCQAAYESVIILLNAPREEDHGHDPSM